MDQQDIPHPPVPHADPSPAMSDDKAPAKPPVVRGARACTVCRAAKMKCVGADDGNNIPCQRCKRSGAECIFEKHRRGRKPGSRLSEASKMLRRLEKGLNSAKQKSSADDPITLPPLLDQRNGDNRYRMSDSSVASGSFDTRLAPLNLPPHARDGYHRSAQPSDSEMDEDDDSNENESGMYPARIIKQNARNSSFFKTILNPEQSDAPTSRSAAGGSERGYSQHPQSPTSFVAVQPRTSVTDLFNKNPPLQDPIDAGLIDEETVTRLWDMFYIRLNPFINLFDPALHSVKYVRSRCPFLFTTLVMACCKFFKTELYVDVLRLAHEFAVRAFAENWKRVEVVQAFACMTYWKEPDDTRTWTYIGYACRMAVELGLNRYVGKRPPGETDYQLRERRNRERTYLVLFVHDRSLSMQTGKHWMLPEDELVRNSTTWHEEGGMPIRQEDVVVAAFTQLRHIAAETTDVFNMHQGGYGSGSADINYEMLLRNCNQKLNGWVQNWNHEMKRANGEQFHFSFLRFFQLHVRLFLNTFGINSSSSQPGRGPAINVQALHTCYESAMANLQIMADDFARVQMLRYGQDSTTVMTAYSAVVLLKLLRGSSTLADLKEGAVNEIHSMISRTAKAYQDAAHLSPASSSAAYHARFLQSLVGNDLQKMQQQQQQEQEQAERERFKRELPPLNSQMSVSHTPAVRPAQAQGHPQMYSQVTTHATPMDHSGYFTPSSNISQAASSRSSTASSSPYTATPTAPYSLPREDEYHNQPSMADSVARNGALTNYSLSGISTTYAQYQAQPTHEQDTIYWRNMFKDLGFGESADHVYGGMYQANGVAEAASAAMPSVAPYAGVPYREAHATDHGYQSQQYQHHPQQHQYQYAVMNSYQSSGYSGR